MNANQTQFLALSIQIVDGFTNGFGNRTHGNDNIFGIGGTIIGKRVIFAAGDFGNLLHVCFNHIRNGIVKRIGCLFRLKEDIRVLCSTTSDRMLRIKRTVAECLKRFHVEQRSKIVLLDGFDLLNFVRSAETVEEVHERDTAFDGGKVRYTAKVHRFLYRTRCQHGKAGLTARVNVAMVAKDRKCVTGQCSCTDVENSWQQFAGNLIHIGDHQQQTLRGSVSCSQCPRL